MKKDNSTFRRKVELRLRLLKEIEEPVVMETHGGYGAVWKKCYMSAPDGVVFETDEKKVEVLAKQRPEWAVYQADCITSLASGVGEHLAINFLDVDPYGDPWPVVDAFFRSNRPRPDCMAVAVNDGLRQKVRMGGGWDVDSLAAAVEKYGASVMHDNYLEVCAEMLQEKAGQCGYSLTRWAGYYCGHADQMTHYGAVFQL